MLVRAPEAETIAVPGRTITLLVDGAGRSGAVGAHRVRLDPGMEGAAPHAHSKSSELLYVASGRVEILVAERTAILNAGDLAVVPHAVTHAFAATADGVAEVLVVSAPGVAQFEYFRQFARAATGEAPTATLHERHLRFDVFPRTSERWRNLGGG